MRRVGPLLLAASLGLGLCGLTEPPPPTAPPVAPPAPNADVRFEAVDVFVDAGESPLSAYQFDLTTPAREGWQASIVGVEGGEHPAFRKAPYYDPAALRTGRIIIAAYSVDEMLPTGRTRVARVHMELRRVASARSPDAADLPPSRAAPAIRDQAEKIAPPAPAALPAVESAPPAKKAPPPGRPSAPATTGAPASAPAAAPSRGLQADAPQDPASFLGGYAISLTTAATTGGKPARATVSLARAAPAPTPTPTPPPTPPPPPAQTPVPGGTP